MTFDTYNRTFHPNWIGIIGTAALVVFIVGALVLALRKRTVRE
jgi:hypothetical protein